MKIWRDIPGYEGLYQVSSLGRVKRLNSRCGAIYRKEHLLKPFIRDRYKSVRLSKNNRVKNYNIHVLVAKTFISNPNNYEVINHIDGDKFNNIISNLEWCTQSHNCNHAVKNDIASKQYSVTITDLNNDSKLHFKSTSLASKYLGFSRQWVITNIRRKGNPFKYNNYEIEVIKNDKCI